MHPIRLDREAGEALHLVKVFNRIRDADARAQVIALAEIMARAEENLPRLPSLPN
jgi:hypothetical protein